MPARRQTSGVTSVNYNRYLRPDREYHFRHRKNL